MKTAFDERLYDAYVTIEKRLDESGKECVYKVWRDKFNHEYLHAEKINYEE